MGVEIERKYLVKNEDWRKEEVTKVHMAQGYLNQINNTVRVRLAGDKAFITIKGKTKGIARLEFEYEIPVEDAKVMLTLSQTPIVEKDRHIVHYKGHVWEVDEFHGANEGLVVAEVELKSEDEVAEKPDWIGMDVSEDKRYRNTHLAVSPYSTWEK